MRLSDTGEARVRGYLFVLGRSLRSFLPHPTATDALREIESHIRERVDDAAAEPDERAALEALLAELGEPLRVARAYSGELAVEEAVATGRAGATARAVWHLATSSILGFFPALGLLLGYSVGLGLLAIAVLKPVFPANVGLLVVEGMPRAFGVVGQLPAGGRMLGGYWLIPVTLAFGLAALLATHRGSRRYLEWWRSRSARRAGYSTGAGAR